MIGEDPEYEQAHDAAANEVLRKPPEDATKLEKIIGERIAPIRPRANTLDELREKLDNVAPDANGPRRAATLDRLLGPPRLPSLFGTGSSTPFSPQLDLPGTSSPNQISPESSHSATMGFATAPGPPVGSTHALNEGDDGLSPRDYVGQEDPDAVAIEMEAFNDTPDPERQDEQPEGFLVQPGGPGITVQQNIDLDDPTAFFHPATKEPMRILWLPRDTLGLCEAEIEACEKIGIKATHKHAILTTKNKVKIFGPPPDDF